jgi:uncharacterized membrane protein
MTSFLKLFRWEQRLGLILRRQRARSLVLWLVALVGGGLVLLQGCARVVVNSADNDELIASVSNLQGGANFKAAIPAVIAKCANCHTHQAWYGYDEVDYVSDGLVVPGDVAGSRLYFRLSTATQGPGPRNMPQGGGAAFTENELSLMTAWIQSL